MFSEEDAKKLNGDQAIIKYYPHKKIGMDSNYIERDPEYKIPEDERDEVTIDTFDQRIYDKFLAERRNPGESRDALIPLWEGMY